MQARGFVLLVVLIGVFVVIRLAEFLLVTEADKPLTLEQIRAADITGMRSKKSSQQGLAERVSKALAARLQSFRGRNSEPGVAAPLLPQPQPPLPARRQHPLTLNRGLG